MKRNITLAYSPCPNDTFIFHAMVHGLVDTGDYRFIPHLDDVESLNESAFTGRFDVTKLSFHAWLLLKGRYALLDSGSALGFGCGPLLVTRNSDKIIEEMKIAVPGRYTTALMLLKLWKPAAHNITPMRFDLIMECVKSGEFDAGLIIHEGRFVFQDYGLTQIIDLGEWWEQFTSSPIPLGCIAADSAAFSKTEMNDISTIIKSSVEYAFADRSASADYIKQHARELDDGVIESHINLYVNKFTLSLGSEGHRAVELLESMAKERGIIK